MNKFNKFIMEKGAFEPTGLVPRSIIRTFHRFLQQLLPGTDQKAIQEFRISRSQVLVSIQCLFRLITIPLLVNFCAKTFLITPVIEHWWNSQQNELFLNSYQENRAFLEMQDFSEKFFFESLVHEAKNESSQIDFLLKQQIQKQILELSTYYNQQSILALTNLIGDCITVLTLISLFIMMKPEILILKSFLTESIYSLSDTTKSFLLILLTDLLVGFHSPRGWEVIIEVVLRHFGFPENQDFIFLFVATVPVFLDTVFKYWIFRYLNKISPSTVATYHSMIE